MELQYVFGNPKLVGKKKKSLVKADKGVKIKKRSKTIMAKKKAGKKVAKTVKKTHKKSHKKASKKVNKGFSFSGKAKMNPKHRHNPAKLGYGWSVINKAGDPIGHKKFFTPSFFTNKELDLNANLRSENRNKATTGLFSDDVKEAREARKALGKYSSLTKRFNASEKARKAAQEKLAKVLANKADAYELAEERDKENLTEKDVMMRKGRKAKKAKAAKKHKGSKGKSKSKKRSSKSKGKKRIVKIVKGKKAKKLIRKAKKASKKIKKSKKSKKRSNPIAAHAVSIKKGRNPMSRKHRKHSNPMPTIADLQKAALGGYAPNQAIRELGMMAAGGALYGVANMIAKKGSDFIAKYAKFDIYGKLDKIPFVGTTLPAWLMSVIGLVVADKLNNKIAKDLAKSLYVASVVAMGAKVGERLIALKPMGDVEYVPNLEGIPEGMGDQLGDVEFVPSLEGIPEGMGEVEYVSNIEGIPEGMGDELDFGDADFGDADFGGVPSGMGQGQLG